jgi:integrase
MRVPTVNRHLVTLRQVFQFGLTQGHLRANPATNLKPLKERTEPRHRALTDEEVNGLKQQLSQNHSLWMMFMMASGLRKKEGELLRWEDIDFDNRQITVRATTAKDAETRLVPLTKLAVIVLDTVRVEGRVPRGPIFGAPNRREALRYAWRRTGLPGRTPSAHDLRHTFASRAINAGLDLESLRSFMGHKRVTTTQCYIASYGDSLEQAAKLLDGIGDGFVTLSVTPAVPAVPGEDQ